MTIREIETRSGLERTNVRFYEREGLLSPERRENGYRDYSEADLALLLKIKLLRRLGFSLEEIRALAAGDTALTAALERRLASIEGEHRALDAAGEVCQRMRREDAAFPTLDAGLYLDAYDRALRQPAAIPAVPESDRVEPVRCPWRRFFARSTDLAIVSLTQVAVLILVFRVNVSHILWIVKWLMGLLNWVVLVPLEALCLSHWGTTPGKWLLGIRVEHADGRRLTFSEAARRAALVFIYGEGCDVPIVSLYRNWRSYRAVMVTGDMLPWDEDVTVTAQEFHWRHTVRYLAVRTLFLGLSVVLVVVGFLPVHRGDLTTAEFVENYNQLARYYGYNTWALQLDGTFVRQPEDSVIYVGPDMDGFAFTFTETDGILTKVSFQETDADGFAVHWGAYDTRVALAVKAFAQSKAHIWNYSDRFVRKISDTYNGVFAEELWGSYLYYRVTPNSDLPETSATIAFSVERRS